MTEKRGFYTGADEASYKTINQLRRERSSRPTPPNTPADLDRMTDIFTRRQEERRELLHVPERISVALPSTSFIALIGDTHIGGEDVDYNRLHDEISAVRDTDGAYAMLLGDLVDGFFFMPAIQDGLGNLSEEVLFAEAVFAELQGKVLCAWGGDHDLWSEKTGPSMYHRFKKETGAEYLHGLSRVDVQAGTTDYIVSGAHRLPGYSMYNNTHPQMRAHNFDNAHGADVVVSGHTHRKGIARQAGKSVDGSREVVYISVGSYKYSDRYSRKLGFGQQGYDEMGGVGLIVHDDDKRIDVYADIRQGLDDFRRM